MTKDAFHPRRLKPGDRVGPWRIVEPLSSGPFGDAFKAELDGELFTLKLFVTEHVPGEPFAAWRERTRPSAAQLMDIFITLARLMGRLHGHGFFLRDFNSEHVLISSTESRPEVVEVCSAWVPGGSSLTVGLAPVTSHAVPPEHVAMLLQPAGQQQKRFSAERAADLYQLGVFMYEALTQHWPFDPRFPAKELLTAIETAVPRAPHRLNPAVPEVLSRIAMRLLEKRPEDRYESVEALLQALWAASKERSSGSWRVSLELPAEGAAPTTQEEVEERRLQRQEAERRAMEAREQELEELSQEQALEELTTTIQELGSKAQAAEALEEKARAAEQKVARCRKFARRSALAGGPLVLGLALVVWDWSGNRAPPPPGEFELESAASLAEEAAPEPLSAPEPLPMQEGVTRELPSGPLPNQRRPPCKRPQQEINGGCWLRVDEDEELPCADSTYEWKKRCYLSVPAPPRPRSSGDKETPE